MKNKYIDNDKQLQNVNSLLSSIKDDLTTKRVGYYDDSVNILSHEDHLNNKTGELYKMITHVRELERYTNGMSKIELIKMEVTSGFDIYQYDYVKKCMTNKFQSIKKTFDIEWLECEDSLKELRKQKLNKIINAEKDI